jgi:mono/diheme cytochrome c family protein
MLQAIHRLLVVGGVVLAQILLAPAASASSPVFDPAAVYQVACAPCHGVSGRVPEGDPMLQHFKNVPADFTDPLFNSREPASDWFLVTKHGGPSLALSSQMPSFAEAFSDEEISALVAYGQAVPGGPGLSTGRPQLLPADPHDQGVPRGRGCTENAVPGYGRRRKLAEHRGAGEAHRSPASGDLGVDP